MPRRPPPVPPALLRRAAAQEGLVSASQCLAHGVSRQQIAGHVRRQDWNQVVRAVYDVRALPASGRDPYAARRRRAAILGLLAHPGSVATGVCALVLHGVQGAPLDVVPEVAMPSGAPRAAHGPVRMRRVRVERWDDVDGLAVATVPDALAQAVPHLGRRHAVALMDSALQQRLITPGELADAHRAARRRPGVARTHSWWAEADGRAESPAETWARLTCADVGVPPDVLQLPVIGRSGRTLARVDLAWLLPDGGALLAEIDGHDVHSTPAAVVADRERQNRIDSRRTVVRRFTGADAWNGRVSVEVSRVLHDAGWRRRPVRRDAVLRLDD